MNYHRIYNSIIETRKNNPVSCGYFEVHHILPKSLGGTNTKENLVSLTAREHFICHFLLTKMFKKNTCKWYKMIHAFMMLKASSKDQKRYSNSRLYESRRKFFRETLSFSQKGEKNSQYGKMWICNRELGKNQIILKESPIPEGWEKGRIQNQNSSSSQHTQQEKRNELEHQKELRKKYAQQLFDEYKTGNYASVRDFVRKSNYDKSHVNLTKFWKKHIPEYSEMVIEGRPFIIQ